MQCTKFKKRNIILSGETYKAKQQQAQPIFQQQQVQQGNLQQQAHVQTTVQKQADAQFVNDLKEVQEAGLTSTNIAEKAKSLYRNEAPAERAEELKQRKSAIDAKKQGWNDDCGNAKSDYSDNVKPVVKEWKS